MIENDYPVPSYIADTFEKTSDWVEVPEPGAEDQRQARILAIDCEMVRSIVYIFFSSPHSVNSAKQRPEKNLRGFV